MKFISNLKKKINKEYHPDFPKINGKWYQNIISEIEDNINPEWYIEIGSRSGNSLKRRKCNFIAIDPDFNIQEKVMNESKKFLFFQQTSDEFFSEGFLQANNIKPKLAFIDGMHLFEYAMRDFINLQAAMPRDGVICIHDVCPFNYEMTTRDDSYLKYQRPWTGDVWKIVLALKQYQPTLSIMTLDASPTGLAVITGLSSNNRDLSKKYDEIVSRFKDMSLQDLGASTYYDMIQMVKCDRFKSDMIFRK